MSVFEEIQAALDAMREHQANLPIIIAGPSVIAWLGQAYPWYPEDKLVASSAAVEGKAILIDPSLDWRP